MSTKTTFIAIVVVILAAICVVFGFYIFQAEAPVQNQVIHSEQQEITIEDKKITDNALPLNIDVTYPYIAGLDDFNTSVESIIAVEMDVFKKNSLDNDAAVKEVDPQGYADYPREYDFHISYEKGQVDADTVSIILSIYTFEGGAHGNGYFIAVNYNPQTKKEILLADMFVGQPDYLEKISDYAVQDLTKQLKEKLGSDAGGWVDEGAGSNQDNFQAFLITKESLVFYFPPYQVAPYAAGDFQVVMPR